MHKVFQGVYESVEFAKLKLLARALERAQVYEGGAARHLVPAAHATSREVGAAEPYSEGIIDYLRAVEGADMAVLIREPPRGGARLGASRCAPPWTSWTCRRSRGSPAAAGIARPPASRATSRSSEIIPRVRPRRAPRRLALRRRCRRGRSSRPGSSSWTSRPGPRRSRSSAGCGAGRGRGPGTRGRSTRSRPGPARAALGRGDEARAVASSGSTSATSRTSTCARRTSTGDPEGELVERLEPPERDELEARLERLRGEIELPIPAASAVKIGGERAYRLHRRGVEVEMPLRRSRVDALELIALRRRRRRARPARQLGDVRPRDCGRARRALPRRCGARRSGRSSSTDGRRGARSHRRLRASALADGSA